MTSVQSQEVAALDRVLMRLGLTEENKLEPVAHNENKTAAALFLVCLHKKGPGSICEADRQRLAQTSNKELCCSPAYLRSCS